MKLRYSLTSPYVRKVVVAAIELGIDGRIEKIPTNTADPASGLANDNPLSKVPALLTDDRGHVRASFKLPDALTTYRVMAVATAEDDRFGFGEVVVAVPPRLLRRIGDQLEDSIRAGSDVAARAHYVRKFGVIGHRLI